MLESDITANTRLNELCEFLSEVQCSGGPDHAHLLDEELLRRSHGHCEALDGLDNDNRLTESERDRWERVRKECEPLRGAMFAAAV